LPRCCLITGRCFVRPSKRFDSEGKSRRFGNMTLSRLPILQVAGHLLPWAHAGVPRSMRRLALEVTVQAAFAPSVLSILTLNSIRRSSVKRRSCACLICRRRHRAPQNRQLRSMPSLTAVGYPARMHQVAEECAREESRPVCPEFRRRTERTECLAQEVNHRGGVGQVDRTAKHGWRPPTSAIKKLEYMPDLNISAHMQRLSSSCPMPSPCES
jgi:hypothetical protein